LLPGFPIRTSSDLSSVGSSPRLIAASYVLHRLLMPRHPPCALTNLATKMLASTVQFSKYGQHRHHTTTRVRQRPTTHKGHPQQQKLLRKEVIQPHLPVRLPCYDFVPIASPTFDGSLPKG